MSIMETRGGAAPVPRSRARFSPEAPVNRSLSRAGPAGFQRLCISRRLAGAAGAAVGTMEVARVSRATIISLLLFLSTKSYFEIYLVNFLKMR